MLKFFAILLLIALLGFLVYRLLGLHEYSEYPEKLKPQQKRNKQIKI